MPHRGDNARPRLLRRILRSALYTAALALAVWLGIRYIGVPWVIRRALAAAGLHPATFQIQSVRLSRLRITNLAAGTTPWLSIGSLDVTYSARGLVAARVTSISASDARWTISIRDGQIDLGPTRTGSSEPISLALPFDRLDVKRSAIRVINNGATYDFPMDLTLTSSAPQGIEAHAQVAALGGDLQFDARAAEHSGAVALQLNTTAPAALTFSPGLSGTIDAATAYLAIGPGDLLNGTVELRAGSLELADFRITNLQATIDIRSRQEFNVATLSATLADGGAISAAPFLLNPAAPVIQTRLTAANLSLAQWLPILSSEHATGEGRVGGTLDLSLDLAAGRLTGLAGALAADPAHGFIQVKDADALGALLDRQDPRFATDPVMRPLRDKIVAAFSDFAFHKLDVALSREQDHTVALARISGFGRHGEDPQGINLTLDLHVHDALVELVSQAKSRATLKSAAQDALDRFFAPTRNNSP